MRVECQGEELVLLPEKAVLWGSTLLVADLHLGKAATFRAFGAPVPESATYETLDRLTALIDRVKPKELAILGDLFHAKEAATGAPRDAFLAWRERHCGLELKLIVGNHDRKAFSADELCEWSDCIDQPPFRYAHHPGESDLYIVCGHIHPGFRLRAPGHRSQTLPCFWFAEHYAVIPAFGSFTGLAVIEPEPDDRVYVTTDREVIAMPRG